MCPYFILYMYIYIYIHGLNLLFGAPVHACPIARLYMRSPCFQWNVLIREVPLYVIRHIHTIDGACQVPIEPPNKRHFGVSDCPLSEFNKTEYIFKERNVSFLEGPLSKVLIDGFLPGPSYPSSLQKT